MRTWMISTSVIYLGLWVACLVGLFLFGSAPNGDFTGMKSRLAGPADPAVTTAMDLPVRPSPTAGPLSGRPMSDAER